MTLQPEDIFDRLKSHYESLAAQLVNKYHGAKLLPNPADLGDTREKALIDILRPRLSPICQLSQGGVLYGRDGTMSRQIDVIVTANTLPTCPSGEVGSKTLAFVDGTIGVFACKSIVDTPKIHDALDTIRSIPVASGLVTKNLPNNLWHENLSDMMFKGVMAVDGPPSASKAFEAINSFYAEHPTLEDRKLSMFYIPQKYVVYRITQALTGQHLDPQESRFAMDEENPDCLAFHLMVSRLQTAAWVSQFLQLNYLSLFNNFPHRRKKS